MLVYQDLLTGDELLSDSFACKEIENGMLWEVDGKRVVKGAIDLDIGANPSAERGEDEGVDDTAMKVVDIVDTFRLQLLTPKLDEEKQELFKKHIEGATKFLLSKLKDLQFITTIAPKTRSMVQFEERLSRLETAAGLEDDTEWQGDPITKRLDALMEMHHHYRQETDGRLASMARALDTAVVEINALRLAVAQVASQPPTPAAKRHIPEPATFGGARVAKELENFLFDMEHYFRAAKIPDTEMIDVCAFYLRGYAKLWWRTSVAPRTEGADPEITSWDQLKTEMRAQFKPTNTLFSARKAIRDLRHTGSMRKYVKQFASLLLEVPNMEEEEKFHNFLGGLQDWAFLELQCKGVTTYREAVCVADGLVDLRGARSTTTAKGTSAVAQSRPTGQSKQKKFVPKSKGKVGKFACFICGGPHKMRDCCNC